MPNTTLSPIQMPPMWQEMVNLALGQPIVASPSSWDWKALRTLTVTNNLTSTVHTGAKQALPPAYQNHATMIELRLLAKLNRLKSQERIAALIQLAAVFPRQGIPMLAFKGPILSLELFGDPAVRNSCDLDILVPEDKLSSASHCLRALGYIPQPSVWDATPKRKALQQKRGRQMHLVFRKNGVTVELHWRICYRFAVSFDTLWKTKRTFLLDGQPVFTLGSQENLCYLITHGAGHGFRQLRWLLEIHTLLERTDFDLSALYDTMAGRGVGMLLLEVLVLLYRLPGFPMPTTLCLSGQTIEFRKTGQTIRLFWNRDAANDVRKALRLVNAVTPLLQRTDPREGLDGRYYKHLLPRLEGRTPFLLSLFAPDTPELEWIDLPDSLFFLYYFLRPVHYLLAHSPIRYRPTPDANKNGDRTP